MSKTKLREEYEAMFGAVVGVLKLYDDKGTRIYFEDSSGWWSKRQYDAKGNMIYCENSEDYWAKRQYDAKGNMIYFENSDGQWRKYEYDDKGNVIYYETSRSGVIKDNRPCINKVFIDEQSGKKFKLTEIK